MVFISFILFLSVWLALSGKYDVFHVSLGIISSLIVAYTSRDLINNSNNICKNIKIFIKFLFYIPWLIYQIILSNFMITRIVLSKNVIKNINPRIFTYETVLTSDLAKMFLANSITLTPGTITISVVDNKLTIHALKEEGAIEGVKAIEDKLLKVFS
ncbi:MAG: Na+/H+ antiporter subunit E [Bdellovibrionota bacterium]|nr:Na+/H+ antiporter subunit E [Pseudomonadota bacterium]MDY6090906.1 Na+/H+ antiporter subunit E [Bdellovibrionota bacterium]